MRSETRLANAKTHPMDLAAIPPIGSDAMNDPATASRSHVSISGNPIAQVRSSVTASEAGRASDPIGRARLPWT